jgi:hypothetical protein
MAGNNFVNEGDFSLRLNDVEETLKVVDGKVDKIYDAVIGNEKFDQQGIIGRLKKIEQEIETTKALKNKLIGAFVFGGIAWTIVSEAIKLILTKGN